MSERNTAGDRLSFHAFTQFGWPDGNDGLWCHPELVPPRTPVELKGWLRLARIAERGCFDSLFLADAMGMGGFEPGDVEIETRAGRTMLYDPAILIPLLAQATEDLGFVFTNSILQDHPFTFARRVSTLDHLTHGRVGWNIVTSYSPNAARNFGLDDLPPRDERYSWAQEYADVTYQLWEGSWDDGAVIADAARGIYVDPEKVRMIEHSGARYRVQGPHLSDPTPQRTPLLVQAGGSPPGRAFAARNAELQFVAGRSPEQLAEALQQVRQLAVEAGRHPNDVKFVLSQRFVVGSTEAEAKQKVIDRDAALDWNEVAAYMRSETGIDVAGRDPDARVDELLAGEARGMQGVVEALLSDMPSDRPATARDLLHSWIHRSEIVGTPEQIADRLSVWQRAGIGGVAVGLPTRVGSLEEFVDHVIPELQRRGLAQREYTPGTLRQKLMGYGARLPARHPGARFRTAAAGRA